VLTLSKRTGEVLIESREVDTIGNNSYFKVAGNSNSTVECKIEEAQSPAAEFVGGASGIAHVNVHPHEIYDQTALLPDRVSPLLHDERLRNYILLEGRNWPARVASTLPGRIAPNTVGWNPANGVTVKAVGNASAHVAPGGDFNIAQPTRGYPLGVIMTGGFRMACVGNAMREILASFLNSSRKHFVFMIPRSLMLDGPTQTVQGSDEEVEAELAQMIGDPAIREWAANRGLRTDYIVESSVISAQNDLVSQLKDLVEGLQDAPQPDKPTVTVVFAADN
jgi:hypothetical protein